MPLDISENEFYTAAELQNPPQGIFMARDSHVRKHLIENGALNYTWLDLETTDKEWQTLEITVASLTTTDIAYNLVADELYEVCVPDRNVLSPEAMAITQYLPKDVRNPKRLSPQIAAARIFEDVQDAPFRQWDMMMNGWRGQLGEDLWHGYIDWQQKWEITYKDNKESSIEFCYYPLLDDDGRIIKTVRLHAPSKTRKRLEMSYLVPSSDQYSYKDKDGLWIKRDASKFNLGFRNTYFDNRALAACLFRANFPHKEIYAMNKKGLGNYSVDVFTLAAVNYFFSQRGRQSLAFGTKIDPETRKEKVTAKLDTLMEDNQHFSDPDIDLPEGVRIWDGTLHNLKKGHNKPDYDNAKSIAVHRACRQVDPDLTAHIEGLGNIARFRDFMNSELEEGAEFPTSHPIRFIISTADDNDIYRAHPVMILGSDDQNGKMNRIWALRLDRDFSSLQVDGKRIGEMSVEELSALIGSQRGKIDALFHEIHLKRHRGIVDMETGLASGAYPDLTPDLLRFRRDEIIHYIDEENNAFLYKALDAWEMQYSFDPPADDYLPYLEEELWTAMGDVKYPYITDENGVKVFIPRLIRDMAQEEFKQNNDRLGDTVRALIRPHRLEWSRTPENAVKYAKLRNDLETKILNYSQASRSPIELAASDYSENITSKNYNPDMMDPETIDEVYLTLIKDKHALMAQVVDTTRQYHVEILRISGDKDRWQKISFENLSKIPDHDLNALRDQDRLRIKFEDNPNYPTYIKGIRYFYDNKLLGLLSDEQIEYYHAETAFRVWGPPWERNVNNHRMNSVPKAQQSIDFIRRNQTPTWENDRELISAVRKGEIGAYDIFTSEDGTNSIIYAVARDCERLLKKYPFTDDRKSLVGMNPQTNDPYVNVEYVIPEEHLSIEVPEGIADTIFSDKMLGPVCFVVPDVKDLMESDYLVMEEKLTGRRFHAANHIFYDLPDRERGDSYEFYKKAESGYENAGLDFPENGKIVSCSELVPVSKLHDQPYPVVSIQQRQLLATKAPFYAGFGTDQPLTGFIVRQYNYNFRKSQKIRLCGCDENGEKTGWEAKAEVASKPQEILLKDLLADICNPEKIEGVQQLAVKCGFGNAADLEAYARSQFTRFDENLDDPENKLYCFDIHPVKRIVHWTPKQPQACFAQQKNKAAKKYKKLEKKPRFRPKSASIRTPPKPV